MLRITTLKKKEKQMKELIPYVSLVLALLNLGLVIIVLKNLNGLRRDLRTPIVKKFNPLDFNKRKPVDVQKESDKKDFRQNRNSQGNAALSQNKSKNNSQQNRPQQVRRPAVKAPDVFSNELPAGSPANIAPPRPTVSDASAIEGRRPLQPRFAAQQEPRPVAQEPSQVVSAPADDYDGIELDRSKMTHGRRNMVKKALIDDDDDNSTENT